MMTFEITLEQFVALSDWNFWAGFTLGAAFVFVVLVFIWLWRYY